MLLTNGRIHTLDAAGTVVDTLAVRDGRVRFAGRRQDLNVPAGEETLNLGGRAVLPGLVDGHAHLMALARGRLTLDVTGLTAEEEIARRVAETAARTPRGEWIGGRGWDQNLWPGMRFPTRASLDRAAPHHPVALIRVDGHAIWANAAALHAAGISRDTRDPSGGIVVKDAYASRQEAELGALTPGRRADLVVCSDDVFTCPEERIPDIVPLLTLVSGEVVFRREAQPQ
ncbi:MAG: hypothetical protein A2X51_06915 [Candidatus Rokubacteria bacterium GWC2_70_24]|nr:MAG: hypothetical protein A2X51_06915 [Candidatus Rokubacteria bacterium GWC2_70_24]